MKRELLLALPLIFGLVGCGDGSDTSTVGGYGSIDLRSYFPFENVTKNYKVITKKRDEELKEDYITEEISVDDSKIETKIFGVTDSILKIGDEKLVYTDVSAEGNDSTVLYRYVDVGGVIYSKDISKVEKLKEYDQEIGQKSINGTRECILEEELTEFSKDSHFYSGNIIKIKCTNSVTVTTKIKDEYLGQSQYSNNTENVTDISYKYLLNGIGIIASIDDNCIPAGKQYPDDTKSCAPENREYQYMYYLE
jgi:hypothetical protein